MGEPVHRQTATAGLCTLVLLVAGMIIAGVAPDASASPTDLQAYVAAQRHGILVSLALFQVAFIFIFVFFAGLARIVSGAKGEAFALAWGGFAGGVGLQAVALAGTMPFVAAAWRGADAATLRLTYDANLLSLYGLTAGLSIASIALPTLAGLMTRTLPAWIAAPALLLVAANIAEIIGFVFFDSGAMALGAAPGLVAVPAWTLWVGCVSFALLRGPRT